MKKEFLTIFRSLCTVHHDWQVWENVITMIALAISNVTEYNKEKKEQREKEYQSCIQKLSDKNEVEKVAALMAIIVNALEENPEQDFLGQLYMELGLGNHWKGQFFTPYHVAYAMAELTCKEIKIATNEFIPIHDCCCGAGVTFIAQANMLRKKGIHFQQQALFVGQDIDRIAAMMCYIQISLLGCAGYIVVGNSLSNPIGGTILSPIEKDDLEIWYTPMFYHEIWQMRKLIQFFSRAFQKDK